MNYQELLNEEAALNSSHRKINIKYNNIIEELKKKIDITKLPFSILDKKGIAISDIQLNLSEEFITKANPIGLSSINVHYYKLIEVGSGMLDTEDVWSNTSFVITLPLEYFTDKNKYIKQLEEEYTANKLTEKHAEISIISDQIEDKKLKIKTLKNIIKC